MATSTFERKIVISDLESLKRLAKTMADKTPKKPISEHPFSIKAVSIALSSLMEKTVDTD